MMRLHCRVCNLADGAEQLASQVDIRLVVKINSNLKCAFVGNRKAIEAVNAILREAECELHQARFAPLARFECITRDSRLELSQASIDRLLVVVVPGGDINR